MLSRSARARGARPLSTDAVAPLAPTPIDTVFVSALSGSSSPYVSSMTMTPELVTRCRRCATIVGSGTSLTFTLA